MKTQLGLLLKVFKWLLEGGRLKVADCVWRRGGRMGLSFCLMPVMFLLIAGCPVFFEEPMEVTNGGGQYILLLLGIAAI